jgi:hypothetical protein
MGIGFSPLDKRNTPPMIMRIVATVAIKGKFFIIEIDYARR